ncbi:hypothetical protein H0H87_012024, partial [Tephrocybe sp. NHM501043]
MALATSDIMFTTPLGIYMLWLNATTTEIGPWRSWADTHFDYSRIEQYPGIIWRMDHRMVVTMEFSRWVAPACALLFFAFFGFADEARRHYRSAFWAMAKPFGFEPAPAPIKSALTIPSIG